MVKTIIDAAKEWKTHGRRLRKRSFTDHIREEHNLDPSRETVSGILIANDLHRVSTRRRGLDFTRASGRLPQRAHQY